MALPMSRARRSVSTSDIAVYERFSAKLKDDASVAGAGHGFSFDNFFHGHDSVETNRDVRTRDLDTTAQVEQNAIEEYDVGGTTSPVEDVGKGEIQWDDLASEDELSCDEIPADYTSLD